MFEKGSKKENKKANNEQKSSGNQAEPKQDTYKQVKKLSKTEMLTIIRRQKEENELLQKKLDEETAHIKSEYEKEKTLLQESFKKEVQSLKEQLEAEKTLVNEVYKKENKALKDYYEKENCKLKLKIKKLQIELENREININEAGSIAEAAFRINCVMEVAQRAADDYVENIRRINEELEKEYSTYEIEAKAKAEKMLKEAAAQCEEIRRTAKTEAESLWGSLQGRFDSYYESKRKSNSRNVVTPFRKKGVM